MTFTFTYIRCQSIYMYTFIDIHCILVRYISSIINMFKSNLFRMAYPRLQFHGHCLSPVLARILKFQEGKEFQISIFALHKIKHLNREVLNINMSSTTSNSQKFKPTKYYICGPN